MRGLILSGGKSSRMGSPKAEIAYHGEPEYLRCAKLLKNVCSEVFISTSSFWSPKESGSGFELLPDEITSSKGPISGIGAAFKKHPDSAWFVLACDVPFFDEKAMRSLLEQRDEHMDATCFVGYQERPEPLCAIYESSAAPFVLEAMAKEKNCARKVMEQLRSKRVIPNDPKWVDNVNEANEREAIFRSAQQVAAKWIEVKYVAQLREAVGKSVEKIQTSKPTARMVYEDLAKEHGFLLSPRHMRVAINDEIVDWDRPIAEHDRLMFVPPVAGG